MGDWITEPELHTRHRRGWSSRWRLNSFSARFCFSRLSCLAAQVGLLRPILLKLSSAIALRIADSNSIERRQLFIRMHASARLSRDQTHRELVYRLSNSRRRSACHQRVRQLLRLMNGHKIRYNFGRDIRQVDVRSLQVCAILWTPAIYTSTVLRVSCGSQEYNQPK